MEDLKKYNVRVGVSFIEEYEDEDGPFYQVDDVDAREEARKLTEEQLKEQFEKRCLIVDETGQHIMRGPDGNYLDETTNLLWQLHLSLANDFDALKDGE